jgi:hypothetical protein
MLVDNLLRHSNYKALCFDTETESLNLGYSRPYQLSWSIFNRFKVESTFNRYIYLKNFKISKDAAKITKFVSSFYMKNAQDPKVVLDEFLSFFLCKDYLLVGHNILEFDIFQVKNLLESEGYTKVDWSDILSRCIDTMALGKASKLGIQPPKHMSPVDRYCWQRKVLSLPMVKGVSLSSFVENFDKSKLHDSAYDIELNVQAFKNLIKLVEI